MTIHVMAARVKAIVTTAFLSAAFASLLSLPANAEPDQNRFFYVLNGEVLGGYSKINGQSGINTLTGDLLFSPTVKLADHLYWINIYNGSYDHSAQVVSQEEGGRRASTTQTDDLSTALKYEITDRWSIRPLFFVNWTYVVETKDESFGNGLYDYRDLGGGIESTWITLKTKEQQDEVRLGFRYIDREYPNYQSLLYLFIPGGSPENHEKDLNGYKTNLSFDSRSRTDWSWGLEGIFFMKDYVDKKTIDPNGILTNKTRLDTLEYLNIYLSHTITPEWTFRLDGQFSANQSNLDYYDTHNTLSPADDNFIKNYFGYTSWLARPSVTYRHEISKEKFLTVSAIYSLDYQYYPDRNVQDESGVYQSGTEHDLTQTIGAKASVPLTKNISWVTSANYTFADSNQKFQQFYLYSYDLWSAVTGISIHY